MSEVHSGSASIDTGQLLAERRASGWLPALGISQAMQQPEEQIVQSLSVYGNPLEKDGGSFFRWNWVYEWAQTQFRIEGHEDYIRETAEGIMPQAGNDWDRAVHAATQHTAKLWATEIVEAVLDING
ncbi:hypothetical protein DEI97_014510 [Curtobacterium sp. MCLR17_032]|uniref:hypothetical protein n=1 Tax=Curtobacterium sp. MCLR17_032 TaxID=2175650 RepID=UPI000DAABEE3|nr:hypothetical protein [Curtobacterium sp. MCLR17_032]WIE60950.1 hypothetical protein DEI97_014510 [Curtobacterium sp. MCLR17_032]